MVSDTQDLKPSNPKGLNIKQQNAIDLLVTGCSDLEAGKKVGVDRSTVTNWRRKDPAFQEELNLQRQALWGSAKEKYRSLLLEAVDVITDAIRDPSNKDRVKLAMDLVRSAKLSDSLSETNPSASEENEAIDANKKYEDFSALVTETLNKFPEAKQEFLRKLEKLE